MSVDSAGKAVWIRAQEEQELREVRGMNKSNYDSSWLNNLAKTAGKTWAVLVLIR